MITSLILSAYVFGAVATIAVLLITASFTRSQRARFPVLRRLDGKKLGLTIVAAMSLILSQAFFAWKDALTLQQPIEFIALPNGAVFPKATDARFKKEIQVSSGDLIEKAIVYFEKGTNEVSAQRHTDASRSFARSVSLLPTMSGYINLGMCQIFLDEVKSAEDSFRAGLLIAQNQSDSLLEAMFYGNLAFTASKTGSPKKQKCSLHRP